MPPGQCRKDRRRSERRGASFRDNTFANPERLVFTFNKHAVGAKVRPDMKVVFFDEWDTADERIKGAEEILRALATIAEKGAKAA